MGVQVALVIGGGNIFRGKDAADIGIEKVQGDHMGMLATLINGLALQSALENVGLYTRLMSAVQIDQIAEPYIRRRAVRHLEKNRWRHRTLTFKKALISIESLTRLKNDILEA